VNTTLAMIHEAMVWIQH